jgi:DNA repair photolyase
LEVCAWFGNPVGVITKAPLIERDADLLAAMGDKAHVTISVPFWDPEKARAIEPYVATPQRRLRTIAALAARGITVAVNVAPVIPGLNDQDIPRILTAAKEAGASHAGLVLLRLPGSVKEVFEQRLRASLPLQADRVLHRIRETRGGKLYDARFGVRGKGEGVLSESIQALFRSTAQRLGLAVWQDE